MHNLSHFDLIEQESHKIGCQLTRESCEQLELYFRELIRWNQKINLIGHTKEKDIIANLFIDSLAFQKVFNDELPNSVLDIGSGAGFPGLPLKIYKPKLSVTLVEPNLKKVAFLHHIIGSLGLKNVYVEAKRIEEMPNFLPFQKTYDWILLKALRYDVCLPYVKPLLREKGKVVLSRTKKHETLPEVMGFTVQKEVCYQLPFGFGEREFLVLSPIST